MGQNNIAELNSFFRIIQPKSLLGKYEFSTLGGKKPPPNGNVASQLLALLINTGDGEASTGILKMRDLVNALNLTLGNNPGAPEVESFHDLIRVYSGEGKVRGSEEVYWKEGKSGTTLSWADIAGAGEKPKLGVIQTYTPFISQNVRDVNRIALFMNTIPTLEFSRAVPHLDIKFQFRRSFSGDNSTLRAPSLMKFLEGGMKVSGQADKIMAEALVGTEVSGDGDRSIYKGGMELFTATQTLITPLQVDDVTKRYTPVLDPMRPFMSIESFEVSGSPTVGMFSYKTAKLQLTLHDRSRLGEVSDLVRPEVYTNTTLNISYGWNHPDAINSDNAFGDLINRMKMKNEKYGIVNASFTFDAVGQCKITLELAMKGVQEMKNVKLIESSEYQGQVKQLEELTRVIAELREKAGYARPENIQKEVMAYQILDAAERGELASELSSKAITSLIEKLGKSSKSSPNATAAKELSLKLKELFTSTGAQKGMLETLKSTLDAGLARKFDDLSHGADPFLDHLSPLVKAFNGETEERGKSAKRVCSLAKVFLTFVGKPFQSIKNLDELQFVFYQFNSNAGQLGDTNVGSFPVDIASLRKNFAEHVKGRGNPNLSVNEFVLMLNGAIIQDPRAIGYGLREAYLPRTDKDKEPQLKKGKEIGDVLAQAVKGKGSFKYPIVEAYIETLAERPVLTGSTEDDLIANDIMRIHIYDKTSSPYEPMMQMMKSQTGLQEVLKKSSEAPKEDFTNSKLYADAINFASEAGLQISKEPGQEGRSTLKGTTSMRQLKDFIAATLPTFTYGSNNSAIIVANLQTQQNSQLSTVQMLRSAGKQNSTEPNGSAFGGIPLRVIPTQLDMQTFGCPLLNCNQQFFIDFNTGTTVDNVYLVHSFSHTIRQGSFQTHLNAVLVDSYGIFENVIGKVEDLAKQLDILGNGVK